MEYNLTQLLKTMVDQNASDLHISVNSPPRIRINGSLVSLQVPALTSEQAKELCYSSLENHQKAKFEQEKEVDLAFSVPDLARFRANIFLQKGEISGSFRVIPSEIKSLDDLHLPPVFKELCSIPRGLILVTGPTGSGKSTTLAAMVDHINQNRYEHIVTVEDPIEFLHPHKNCVVNQRELGGDTDSFARALKSILRQDPDIVLVGEMRDLETISAAVTTAETGHLVFATLHTNSCVQTLNRIIDAFPPHQQGQVRAQLSMSLQAVISQTLIPRIDQGRCLALEVMIPNSAIQSLISEGKFNQIYSYMQQGQNKSGMQTLNQSLFSLVTKKTISKQLAFEKSNNVEELAQMFTRVGNTVAEPNKKPA